MRRGRQIVRRTERRKRVRFFSWWWLLEELEWRREREFGLVRNELSCGSLGRVEEYESSVLYFMSLRVWLLIEFCPLAPVSSQVGTILL
jgi:hypothetical protein